jgi:hypothetical protein
MQSPHAEPGDSWFAVYGHGGLRSDQSKFVGVAPDVTRHLSYFAPFGHVILTSSILATNKSSAKLYLLAL